MLSLRRSVVPALVTSIAGAVLLLSPLGSALEQGAGLSWLFNLRGPIDVPSNVIIVSIDAESAVMLDQPSKLRDWDRSLHADVVRELSRRGADVIVFDVFFDESRPDGGDIEFAQEIRSSERVILAQQVQRDPVGEDFMIDRLLHPTQVLQDSAFGLAPFPLPAVRNRFAQFWAFYSGVSFSSTLPVVALQTQVLGGLGYKELVGLLEVTRSSAFDQLPRQIRGAKDLQILMELLRSVLQSNPSAVENLELQLRTLSDRESVSAPLMKSLEALVRVYSGRDSYYLNFYGPPETITTIPYNVLLNGADGAVSTELRDLRGKAVFIGGTANTPDAQTDRFFTVFSDGNGGNIAGVEIAATAYANLLENQTLRPASALTNLALIVGFGGIVGVLGYRLAGTRAMLAILVVGVVYVSIAVYFFASAEVWLPITIPGAVQLPVALVSGYLLQYLQARRTIGLYVPERVARDFDKGHDPAAAPEESFFGICMSTDAQGYTTVTEKIPDPESARLMKEYFGLLMPCVARHQGEVPEVRGDGMNSVFPKTGADEDFCVRACLAACDILQAVDRFNEENPDRQLPTRIGLHVGNYSIGNVGSHGRLALCIHGDTIIAASRIQELNKKLHTRLLASSSVVRELDDWLARRVCDFQPKGKTEILSIYEVFGAKDSVMHDEQQLCEEFALAMQMLEASRWLDAARAFASILSTHPNDGPSLFYLGRCQRFQDSPPPPGESALIRAN